MKKDTYVYQLGDSLYINLTNKCSNSCVFCVRNTQDGMEDYNLWLEHEPSAQEVISLIPDPTQYKEVVFCGFGEPTERLDVLLEIAAYLKQKGGTVRINTNGHASLIAGKDVAPLLKDKVDVVSISLNASNAEEYQRQCRCVYGLNGFDGMLRFAQEAKKYVPSVILSIVDILPKQEQEACKELCARLGLTLRIREMIN
ncbi:MAG: TatD family nuclease-associated radical SAM protein [Clostridia bacterium]|nr:TatD family nuclease-associated radical SAM protein [Clostridia bacterium]